MPPAASPTPPDYTPRLRSLMMAADIPSFRALSQTAIVSKTAVNRLRRGQAAALRGEVLHQLAQALHRSIPQLLQDFSDLPIASSAESTRQPDDQPTQQQTEELRQAFQQEVLHQIESWLIQWPTAVYAAQKNPQVPASRLVPLLRPVEHLLDHWGLEAIAPVGDEVAYDPQQHQLLAGHAQAGDRVLVRYTGYRQGDRLLHRAKVSPVQA
ncbi:helix-turn-helix domain-containing protein [Leptolyngbya sp. CCY15150]|uniref:helix-turn-helix domain-containing protein n=1 Tax=Leptolyngbya sp. CCY15150 TaxID=2767772 RepID=UPI0019509A27|nr:helix-turn-helix domain-containing protein [Leptolyngbya sp. CCY15150]